MIPSLKLRIERQIPLQQTRGMRHATHHAHIPPVTFTGDAFVARLFEQVVNHLHTVIPASSRRLTFVALAIRIDLRPERHAVVSNLSFIAQCVEHGDDLVVVDLFDAGVMRFVQIDDVGAQPQERRFTLRANSLG